MPVFVPSGKKLTTTSGHFVPQKRARLPGTAAQRAFVRKHGKRGFFEKVGTVLGAGGKEVLGFGPGLYKSIESITRDVAEQPWSLAMGPAAPLWAIAAQRGKGHTYKEVAKPMARGTAYQFGPFFRGDFGEGFHRAGQAPLSFAATASLPFTLGTSGAVRAGLLKSAGRSTTLRGEGAIAGSVEEVAGRTRAGRPTIDLPITGSEFSRRLKLARHKALNRLPPDMRGLGRFSEPVRYAKAISRKNAREVRARQFATFRLEHAESKLSPQEMVAVKKLVQYRTVADLERHKAALPPDAPLLRLLNDPEVMRLYQNPSKKMRVWMDEHAKLTAFGEQLAGIDNATRPYLPILLARGATFVKQYSPLAANTQKGAMLRVEGRFPATLLSVEGGTARVLMLRKGQAKNFPKEVPLDSVEVAGRDVLTAPDGTIPEMVDAIRAEHAAARVEPPVYYPHKSVEQNVGVHPGGGKGPQTRRFRVKQSKGVLELMGRAAVDINVVTPEFMRKVAWASYHDRHADLISAGRKVFPDENGNTYRLRPNEGFVRRAPEEKVGYTEQTAGEFEQRMGVTPTTHEEGSFSGLAKDLITDDYDMALVLDDGSRVVVSDRVSEAIIGEYTRSSRALKNFYDRPTSVWRALVLNLRLGWLVNNVVGNSLLYVLANGGTDALGVIQRLEGNAIRGQVSADFVRARTPEHAATFIGSQTPILQAQSRIAKIAVSLIQGKFAPSKLLRQADIAVEQKYRRRMLTNQLKKNPAFKRVYDAMPEQANRFDAAAERFADLDPAAIDLASKEVMDAMGNFFDLSGVERRALRGIMPFYAWYKAITGIALRMPLDHPMRAIVFIKLGDLGAEVQADDYGLSYLRGSIKLPGGYRLKTGPANPFSTNVGLGQAAIGAGSLLGLPTSWTNRQAAAGLVNPILGLPGGLQNDDPYRGSGLYGIGRGLPETRLAFPFHSKLYSGPSDRWREFWSYLGAPVVKVDPAEARRRANR